MSGAHAELMRSVAVPGEDIGVRAAPIMYRGVPVITTQRLAREFGTDPVRISQNFSGNKSRFVDRVHCFKVVGAELRELKDHFAVDEVVAVNRRTAHLYLWTERGVLSHAKILNTDSAWQVHERLVDTYFAARNGLALPAAQPAPRLPSPARVFRDHFGVARLVGMDRNQAALAANKATVKLAGVDMLGAMEAVHLLAPQQASHITPTQIGVKLGAAGGKALSAQAVNRLLTQYGYQTVDADSDARWKLTDKGAAFGVWMDAPKSNGGASVRQLRWVETVADALAAELAAAPDVAGRA